jgi:hypothetical protein
MVSGVFVIVKKIRDPRNGIRKNSSRIQIPGSRGKIAPDPGSAAVFRTDVHTGILHGTDTYF